MAVYPSLLPFKFRSINKVISNCHSKKSYHTKGLMFNLEANSKMAAAIPTMGT